MFESEINTLEQKLSAIVPFNCGIYSDIRKFLISKSKRIRSKLAIMYLKANNAEITDEIYNILISGELIHNASLLHDDVIDDSELRRGNPTIGSKYSPKLSILSGDFVLALGIDTLLKTNNNVLLKKFLDCAKDMAGTEIMQYTNRGVMPNEDEYLKICRGKTARLFETILESCAISANLQESEAQILGKNFGIMFQIINDTLETSRENDNNNGIYTAYDIFGVEKTKALIDNYKEEILSAIGNYPNKRYRAGIEDLINSL